MTAHARVFGTMASGFCQLCNASHAKLRSRTLGNCCDTCWNKYERFLHVGKKKQSDNEFNEWLARQLFLAARRQEQFGVSTRCEAATLRGGYMGGGAPRQFTGTQCAHWAVTKRDGRPVCNNHAIANDCVFVGTNDHSPYQSFHDALLRLSKSDPEFRAMLCSVVR